MAVTVEGSLSRAAIPRLPAEWRTANPPGTVDVAAGSTRMSPWTVGSQVQLARGTVAGQGGLGLTGYQLSLGAAGSAKRILAADRESVASDFDPARMPDAEPRRIAAMRGFDHRGLRVLLQHALHVLRPD